MILADLLKDAVKRAGVMESVRAAMIVEASDRALVGVFGDGVLRLAKTAYVEGSDLVIYCSHAALGEEICVRGQDILDWLFKSIPDARINKVRLLHKSDSAIAERAEYL